jgi:nucleoside-diphosphate-sugar epimerase
MRIFLTGATGFVGRRLMEKLVEKDFSVCALTRSSKKISIKKVKIIEGDLTSVELDLTKALKNKIIAGAALDVISNENSFNPKKNILINFARKNNNLIITPHIGGATIESWNQTELFVVNMFIKFIKNNRSIL